MGIYNKSKLEKNRLKLFTIHYSLFTLAVLLLVSCGYKPVSHYTRQLFSEPFYLEVSLSQKDPDSGVFLTDAMREAVRYRLGGQLSEDPHSVAHLKVSYRVVSFDALGYDPYGYVERYRVNLETRFDLLSKQKHIIRTIHTTHEADVTPSALHSSKAKREAIKACADKAVEQFIAFVASHEAHQ